MVQIFGRKCSLENIVFPALLFFGIVIMGLNVFYSLNFDASIWNWNMGVGVTLFAYAWYQMFDKK
ncbi:hypothetical protein [Oceanobacillus jeddahense]|uniref:Uncharacterized protein n=1 Tax=Oceanobacillus jeddahense TaxID=1462527 RepID=A0ABY5JW55_9BACI|nr:hypothetical protein [Oceanobacillus jeddahense]UUI04009.1 hypothetical protein NP439_04775 [Oceanobacillus jeddahense]